MLIKLKKWYELKDIFTATPKWIKMTHFVSLRTSGIIKFHRELSPHYFNRVKRKRERELRGRCGGKSLGWGKTRGVGVNCLNKHVSLRMGYKTFQRAKKTPSARKMRHSAKQSDNNQIYQNLDYWIMQFKSSHWLNHHGLRSIIPCSTNMVSVSGS